MSSPSRLVLSSFQTGLETYDKPFLLDNDAFPVLENAMIWRKRLIKKQGAKKLGVLQRALTARSAGNATFVNPSPNSFNLITGMGLNVLEANASIVPGNVTNISITIGPQTLTNTDGTTTMAVAGAGVITAATINYATGVLSITFSAPAGPLAVAFTGAYYPHLPVMGIEGFEPNVVSTDPIDFPTGVYFDTIYAYQWNYSSNIFYDVSFYKSTAAAVTWSGATYQQFFSSNYFRAMFVTNNNPGLHFKVISAVPVVGATTQLTIVGHGLTTSDFIFVNQVGGVTNLNMNGLQVNSVIDVDNITVVTPVATGGAFSSAGIAQYLTRSVSGGGDGIRWYDGDPSGASGKGFSNFAPPLDNLSTAATTYLSGARMILPFGNRLLAIGTFEKTSAGVETYYGNRIRYCQLSPGSPFYGNAPSGINVTANAWVSNIQGYGGFIDLDTTERIISAAVTQDSLILGLESDQRKVVITGVETDPFVVQIVNPDFGSAGTYAVVPLDKGILSAGEYGFLLTTSYNSQRFDEKIIDQIFEIQTASNGFDRICGARDFPNEIVYFTYTDIDSLDVFPNRSVVYNYRENCFSIWRETYTTYGIFKDNASETWADLTYFTWDEWDDPWESGILAQTYPFVTGGTPQGYVMQKFSQSANDPSLFIQSISGSTVVSPNHCLEEGMYVGFQQIGTVSPTIIGQIVLVNSTSSFNVDADISSVTASLWEMVVIDNFLIKTKQFPTAWSNAQKTRIGTQRYFLDKTDSGEFTVSLLGSQSPVPLNPTTGTPGWSSLISSNIVRTRPDASLGLNGTTGQQTQIWHRLSTSIIGDTVQIQMNMSDAQMKSTTISREPWVLHAVVLDLYASRTLI